MKCVSELKFLITNYPDGMKQLGEYFMYGDETTDLKICEDLIRHQKYFSEELMIHPITNEIIKITKAEVDDNRPNISRPSRICRR